MDTNRIKVYHHDESTATIAYTTNYSGFTVVEAPKGPCTPIKINANDAATMQDIFGSSSADYPELFEAEIYNSQYDLYLSAPYSEAKVPAAYLTKKGIVMGSDLVEYDSKLEFYAINGYFEDEVALEAGDADEDALIPGVNSFDMDMKTLVPVKDASLAYIGSALKENSSGNAHAKSLMISLPAKPAGEEIFRLSGLPYNFKDNNYFEVKVTGAATLIEASMANDSEQANTVPVLGKVIKAYLQTNTTGEGAAAVTTITKKLVQISSFADTATESDVLIVDGSSISPAAPLLSNIVFGADADHANYYLWLFGSDAAGSPLTTNNLVQGLDEISERANLILFENKTLASYLGLTKVAAVPATESSEAIPAHLTDSEGKTVEITDYIYAVIFPKFPSNNTLYIDFKNFDYKSYKANDPEARNVLNVRAYEENAFRNSELKSVTFSGSLNNNSTKAAGFNATNLEYGTQNLVSIVPLKAFKSKTDLDPSTYDLSGYGSLKFDTGYRKTVTSTCTLSELHNKGWEKADNPEYSAVDVFFDCERHVLKTIDQVNNFKAETVTSKFFKLNKIHATGENTSIHPYAGCLFNATVNPDILTSIPKNYQLDFGPAYWNICNELVVDLVDGSRFMSTMIGSRALMQTRIIQYMYGGVAPEFTNTGSPAMGGQLPGLVSTKVRFKYTKDQQDLLDEMNFNPVVSDRTYGLMLTGQKTCKDGDLTDWSYIGHVSAFLNFEKEIKEAVMDPQVGKANNPYYRELRKYQAENILNKRLTGSTRIWSAGIVDTSTADGVNDIQAMRARQFRIKIAVKVDTFSEYVILDFTNVDQGTEL